MSGRGAKRRKTSERCTEVSRLRSSSSWFRRKVAHWAPSGSRTAVVNASTSGSASCRASASQDRGLSRKSNIIWARSVGPSGRLPANTDTSLGGTLASQSRTESPTCHCVAWRQESRIEKSCGPGSTPGSICSSTNGAASIRKPDDAELQPEPHHLGDLPPNLRIRPVQVRLEAVETVEVPGSGPVVETPGLLLLAREDHALLAVRRLVDTPDVPVAVRRVGAAARRGEPGMLIGGVVDHEIHHDPDPALPGAAGQLREVAETTQPRVDGVVVADVVAVVASR